MIRSIAQTIRMVRSFRHRGDLTARWCADSIGSGSQGGGGQIDFMYGAKSLKGETDHRPVPALPSPTASLVSKIVTMLQPAAGVVTTRSHVHFVINRARDRRFFTAIRSGSAPGR